MKIWRHLVLLTVALITVLSTALVIPQNRTVAQEETEICPPPEAVAAQRELVQGIINDFIAIRAYKDATLNELARLNTLYYSLRGEYLRGLLERLLLIEERAAILENTELSQSDADRVVEIEDRLLELAVLLLGANETIQEQLLLLAVLWQPVVDLIAGVSVERNERFTQRILEVREGDADGFLALAGEILAAMEACEEVVPGGGGGGGGGQRPTPIPTTVPTPGPATPIPSGVGT